MPNYNIYIKTDQNPDEVGIQIATVLADATFNPEHVNMNTWLDTFNNNRANIQKRFTSYGHCLTLRTHCTHTTVKKLRKIPTIKSLNFQLILEKECIN